MTPRLSTHSEHPAPAPRLELSAREQHHGEPTLGDTSPIAAGMLAADGAILRANRSLTVLLGRPEEQLIGAKFSDFVAEADQPAAAFLNPGPQGSSTTVTFRRHARDTAVVVAHLTMWPAHDEPGSPVQLIAQPAATSPEGRQARQLTESATTDQLTGLPNRQMLESGFLQTIDRGSGNRRGAVLLIDLDRYRLINDGIGHAHGDQLLRAVAQRIRERLPRGAIAYRFLGDSFVVVAEGADQADASELADQIRDQIRQPVQVAGRQLVVTASIGIAHWNPPVSVAEVLRRADVAAAEAKRQGGDTVAASQDTLLDHVHERLDIAQGLCTALANNELRVHFQPIVALEAGTPVWAEALIRWQHPTRGLIPPDRFLAAAEANGEIIAIGRWVLRQACATAAAWMSDTPEGPIGMSVNVSAKELHAEGFVDSVTAALSDTGLPPGLLTLELTEGTVMGEADATNRILRDIKAIGVRVSVDDFGTGYSSLAYLKRYPIDNLKIDKSFIHGLGRDPDDTTIVRAILDLAAGLGLRVIAEGVETAAQRDELLRLGCQFGQGYLWSRPVDHDGLFHYLQANPFTVVSCTTPTTADTLGFSADDTNTALAILSHELRQPLTILLGTSELAQDDPTSSEATSDLAKAVHRHSTQMHGIVELIDDVRSIDRGTLRVNSAPERLCDIADTAATSTSIACHQIVVEKLAEPTVFVDRRRIEQIIVNLLTNAARHAPEDTPIRVKVWSNEIGEACLSVIDSGPGIPPEHTGYVFRKFARSSTGGTGLGLYLARNLARAHTGELRYTTAPNGGACFTLTLPSDGEQPRNPPLR